MVFIWHVFVYLTFFLGVIYITTNEKYWKDCLVISSCMLFLLNIYQLTFSVNICK